MKINSLEENEFVLKLVNRHAPALKQVWIGLNWNALLKTFIWSDNSLPNYTNWNRREPNGNANEPCSHMWTGRQNNGINGYWNDLSCGNNPPQYDCGLLCKRLP